MMVTASLLAFVIIGGYYTVRHMSIKLNWLRILALALFTGYMTGLFSLTLELANVIDNGLRLDLSDLNLIPFVEIMRYWRIVSYSRVAIINLFGNIFIFVPVGFAVALLKQGKHPLLGGWLWSTLLSIFIECFQLLTPRTTDIDDVILNMLGGILGVLLYLVFRKIFPRVVRRVRQPIWSKTA